MPGADANHPLAGVRVVITRAKEQSREVSQRLRNLGATVFSLPAIAFTEPEDCALLDAAIASLGDFDWVLFTSANAVRFFAARLRSRGMDPMQLAVARKSPKVAGVGPATAKSAAREGFTVDHIAAEFRGEALARGLAAQICGKKILLPRSDRAADELPKALRSAGADVEEVVAYRAIEAVWDGESAEALDAVRSGSVDVISFFSPSAFHSMEAQIGGSLERVAIAAIGPVTAAAIRDAGLAVAMEARESTTDGFVAALVKYFGSNASQGVST